MKKITILILSFAFALNFSFAQEDGDFGDFVPGSEQMVMAYYGSVCKNLVVAEDLAKCSNDQIADYIATLEKPKIIDEKQLKTSVVLYFDLTAEGKPVNISIKKSSKEESLDKVVLDHFKKMPNWEPSTINGMAFSSENMNVKYFFKPTVKK